MILHINISDTSARKKIQQKNILFGGNRKLKIYGTLQCRSGKRMKRENRVFFSSEQKAKDNDFRPCGHCMRNDYKKWKNGIIR